MAGNRVNAVWRRLASSDTDDGLCVSGRPTPYFLVASRPKHGTLCSFSTPRNVQDCVEFDPSRSVGTFVLQGGFDDKNRTECGSCDA
jgi:hypothetical protein